MATAAVKDSHLKYNGTTYFRGRAENVLLGSYGEKQTPVTKQNYLEVQGTIAASKLKVRKATIASIDWNESTVFSVSSSAVVKGTIDGVPVKVTTTGDAKADFGAKGDLRLLKLIVEAGDMEAALESSASLLGDFRELGNDARVCHEIWVVIEATLATSLEASGSFSVAASATVQGFELTGKQTLSGGTTKTTKVTISKGTTFAYLLLKADWNHSGLKKTTIKKLTDDQWSFS